MEQKSTLKHMFALIISIMIILSVSTLGYAQQNGLNFDGVNDYAYPYKQVHSVSFTTNTIVA